MLLKALPAPTLSVAISRCAHVFTSRTLNAGFLPFLRQASTIGARTSKMAVKSAADMPTLSLLYKTQKLAAPEDNAEVTTTISYSLATPPTPSKSFNDRISLCRVDITLLELDAIVNAANKSLLGGGGVDGAIHRAAGRSLWMECSRLGGCETGRAKITSAHNLPCKRVIHTVGPVYDPFDPELSETLLTSCYTTSLELAVANKCRTIAFSAISTGIYGYPSTEAAPVAITAVRKFLESDKGAEIDLVVFVVFELKDLNAYTHALPLYFPPVPEGIETRKPSDTNKDDDAAKGKDVSGADTTAPTGATTAPAGATATSLGAGPVAEEGAAVAPVDKPEPALEDIEAEKIANVLPEVPKTAPAEVTESEHVNKKPKHDS
ncbi:hypothetical protein RB595_006164 [Gaeumannomyces hyphopodioides]